MSPLDPVRGGAGEPSAATPASRTGPRASHAELRRLAHEMEGLFVSQLFQAMRRSVPEGGVMERSAGEETFTAMFDDLVASRAAQRSHRGLGEALYRQLARRLAPEPAAGEAP